MAEKFETNLLKLISAEIYFLASMTAAREMYGKSYFSLGVAEKTAIDQAVWQQVFGNIQGITPELLEPTSGQKVGFQPPSAQATQEKT